MDAEKRFYPWDEIIAWGYGISCKRGDDVPESWEAKGWASFWPGVVYGY